MGMLSFLKNLLSKPDARDSETSSDEIGHLEDSFPDPFHPFLEPVAIPISDVFDLHTIRPQEVKLVVEEYLNEAARVGFGCVRIIHGKGIGVQREMVRSILARTSFVQDWSDAPPEAGGLGATIVRLKRSDAKQ